MTRAGRWVLGIVALLLVAAVASASATTAVTSKPTPAGNLAAAQQDASALLARFVAPPGTNQAASEPAGDGGALAGPWASRGTPNVVDQLEWLVAPGAAADVLAYAKSHPPAGSWLSFTGGPAVGPNGPYGVASVGFGWPAIPGVLSERSLVVSAIDLAGGDAGVRVDAQVIWITPRPAWERIPAGVRSVSIVARDTLLDRPSAPVVVRSRARIRRLVALIDGLPIEQPGIRHCKATRGPFFLLRFLRTRSSRPLAQLNTEDACGAIDFRLGDVQAPALNGAAALVDVVNRLGVIPACRTSQLRPHGQSFEPYLQASFTFTTASRDLCLLSGYPRITVWDRDGARLPLTGVDVKLPAQSPTSIDMTPGAAATFVAGWREPRSECPDPAASIQVGLPGREPGLLTLRLPAHSDVLWPCRGRITLEPFSPQL